MATSALADVGQELRRGRVAGSLAIVGLLATLASAPISQSGSPDFGGIKDDDFRFLMTVGLNEGGQIAGIVTNTVAYLLLIPALLQLYSMTRQRNPQTLRWLPWVGLAGIVFICVALPLGYLEVHGTAHTFVDGPRTVKRAQELREGLNTLPTDIARILGSLLFGFWIGATSAEAQRVGLLTRFLGMFGFGAGLLTAAGFTGIVIGLPLFVGWMGSIAIQMLGYWPGGRPPAWDEGRAVSWEEYDSRDAGRLDRSAR